MASHSKHALQSSSSKAAFRASALASSQMCLFRRRKNEPQIRHSKTTKFVARPTDFASASPLGWPRFSDKELWQSLPLLKLALNAERPTDVPTVEWKSPKDSRKTLVLDMDETLIHLVQGSECMIPDVHILTNTGQALAVNLRPFVKDFLKEASKLFEVVVFTAARKPYADAVLNALDPTREFIRHRLYRDDCTRVDGVYVKDLRVLGVQDLGRVVIVDNSPHSFAFQLENGIPITSWWSDKQDRELIRLLRLLTALSTAEDVREILHNYYSLSTRVKRLEQLKQDIRQERRSN